MMKKVEKVKNKWVVFKVDTFYGKVFKTKMAEFDIKKEADSFEF